MWCFRSQQALVLLETVDGAFTPLLGVLPSPALKQEQQSCLPEANWPLLPTCCPPSQGPAATNGSLPIRGQSSICTDLAAALVWRAAVAPGHATSCRDPGRAHSQTGSGWGMPWSRNPLAPAHERWDQGVPQMIQWVACFPLSSCQKCLLGTWLRGSKCRDDWKATPLGPLRFRSHLCVHMILSA